MKFSNFSVSIVEQNLSTR